MSTDKAVRWLLVCAAVVFALILLANFWNKLWAWLPWSAESRLDRAEARADYSESDASARRLEVEGMSEQAARVDTYHTQVIELRDFTARAEAEARSDPDANEPLPADVAAGLGEHQRSLCLARPAVCGAAPAGPAGSRDPAV